MDAWRRHVWDSVVDADASTIAAFMQQNERGLIALYGARGLSNLKTLVEAKALMDRVPAPAGQPFMPSPLAAIERQIGQGIPQLGSRVFAFMSGRMQKGYLVLDAMGRVIRGHSKLDFERAWQEALFNRQLAEDLVGLGKLDIKSPRANRLRTRFFLLGQGTMREDREPNS
jgi:hypothetical protein